MTSLTRSLYGDESPVHSALDRLWRDYVAMNPQIGRVVQALEAEGEKFLNDHIALRTFDVAPSASKSISMERLGALWERWGYVPRGDYIFEAKGLRARHWEHEDQRLPRVFISELITERLPQRAQASIASLLEQVPDDFAADPACLHAGTPWRCSKQQWNLLADVSEYAGWLAAFGLRANHFTVDVRSLKRFRSIREVNHWLKSLGFELNSSGGEIKGSRELCLQQSSTLAAPVSIELGGEEVSLPGCYVEFAERHHDARGQLFSGFVADNADKIFESTDRQPA